VTLKKHWCRISLPIDTQNRNHGDRLINKSQSRHHVVRELGKVILAHWCNCYAVTTTQLLKSYSFHQLLDITQLYHPNMLWGIWSYGIHWLPHGHIGRWPNVRRTRPNPIWHRISETKLEVPLYANFLPWDP
jgi:hypothetical protein